MAARAFALACCGYRTIMEFGDALEESQSNTKPTALAIRRAFSLHIKVKESWHKIWIVSDPIISDL